MLPRNARGMSRDERNAALSFMDWNSIVLHTWLGWDQHYAALSQSICYLRMPLLHPTSTITIINHILVC